MPEPGTPAAAGAPSQPQEPPLGVSSATGPTPNRGYEAAAKQRLGVMIRQLEQMVPMVGATSDIGKDVLKALNMFAKHIQPGEVTPAAERNTLEQTMMQNQQNQALTQQMRAAGAGGQPQPGMPQAAAKPPQQAAAA